MSSCARQWAGCRRRLAGIGLAALLSAPPAAAQESAPNPAVDTIFARWSRPGSPGCALGVVRDGRLVYGRGYGEANLD